MRLVRTSAGIMNPSPRGLPLSFLICAVLAACAPTLRLPTVTGDGSACRDVGLEGVLRGDPRDPRIAWVENGALGDSQRIEVVFPNGFTARFTPALEILDATGRSVARAGDPITGGCVTGKNALGPLLILGAGSPDIRAR